jgi:hypothetical protein
VFLALLLNEDHFSKIIETILMKKKNLSKLSLKRKTIAHFDVHITGGVQFIDASAECTKPTSCCPTTHTEPTMKCVR